jgi:signal transduction histidine kinase/DNA-binding response OmpR family regulator
MTVFNTEMHIVTFLITVFEGAMLFYAFIWFLSRPSDQARSRYMFLLLLLLFYNLCSGLFPDENIKIPEKIQLVMAYFGGISVSMYFVYYIYKTLELRRLKTIALYGAIWGLLLPFILLFVLPFMLTGNVDLSRRMLVIIPFLFSIIYLYTLTKSIRAKYKTLTTNTEREEIIGLYVSVMMWAALPIIVYFDGSQLLEHSITNAGFMIMSVVFVRSAIFKSRQDYDRLLKSEATLRQTNENLQQKVRERTRQLEKANEQRENVFINMVHETKTPLTLINNYLDEVVEKYGASEEMEITKMNLAKLNRNMNNFFDVHKLERGLEIYDHSMVTDFSSILKNIILIFNHWASQKSITIIQKIEEHIYVKADPEALDSIASNLIENAIKYIPERSTITVELKTQEDKAQFVVADNGAGISKNHQKNIFLPYYQVNHKKKNTQGMGMGLAIVKKIVENIGGTIDLTSNPNEGTCISVAFSVVEESERMHKEEFEMNLSKHYVPSEIDLHELPLDATKQHILVVEDNLQLLTYIQKKLSINYNIFMAISGREAINRLKQMKRVPDLILTDIMMDDMDGFEFVKSVRAQSALQHVPVIFLSAIAEHEQKIKGLKMGAVDFISKPFRIEELRTKINSILSNLDHQRIAFMNGATKMMNGNQVFFQENKVSFEDRCKELMLTDRESEIVMLIKEGKSYSESGELLHISSKTVSKHLSNVYAKLGITSRHQLVNLLDK